MELLNSPCSRFTHLPESAGLEPDGENGTDFRLFKASAQPLSANLERYAGAVIAVEVERKVCPLIPRATVHIHLTEGGFGMATGESIGTERNAGFQKGNEVRVGLGSNPIGRAQGTPQCTPASRPLLRESGKEVFMSG